MSAPNWASCTMHVSHTSQRVAALTRHELASSPDNCDICDFATDERHMWFFEIPDFLHKFILVSLVSFFPNFTQVRTTRRSACCLLPVHVLTQC